jgi:hypothetical protein
MEGPSDEPVLHQWSAVQEDVSVEDDRGEGREERKRGEGM